MTFVPYTEEKVWGNVRHIFSSSHAGVSCLVVKRGTCCSLHYHADRVNLFNVLEGKIAVEIWKAEARAKFVRQSLHILNAGDVFEVETGVWHRFRVIESGHVVEVYYPKEGASVRLDDIVRWNKGGSDGLEDLGEFL